MASARWHSVDVVVAALDPELVRLEQHVGVREADGGSKRYEASSISSPSGSSK